MPRPIVDALTKNAAIVGGLVTAIVAVVQLARGVSQSVREFEWKQAEQGRAMVNAMVNDKGWEAMTMLDFPEGRTYELVPGKRELIRPEEVVSALENAISEKAAQLTETQRFIVDRYDRLFFMVSQLQVAIRSGLVRKDDVKFPLSWYVEKRLCKRKRLLLDYMRETAAPETTDFFDSVDAWKRCSPGNTQ
jgi:hypothetical protein